MTTPTQCRWKLAGYLSSMADLGSQVIVDEQTRIVVGYAEAGLAEKVVREHNALIWLLDNDWFGTPEAEVVVRAALGLESVEATNGNR